jgi:hypothetical protein
MSRALDSVCSDGAAPARFRPATPGGKPATHAAGPFDVAPVEEQNRGFGSVLVTGLLVIYPAFATVAAIVVGLSLSGGGA